MLHFADIRNVLNVAVSQEDLPAHQRASLLRVAFDGMRLDLTKPEDVSLKFQDYTIEDQVLLSNSFWAAFECDVEANESMVCATLSVQYDLAWHVLPCTFVPVLLNRHVDVLAWRASHGDRGTAPIDTVLAMLKKKKPPYFVLDETAGMLRTRYSAMVACKLYDETRVHGGDVLARLDSKLKRSLAPPSHGHGLVCEELTNGVTTLMECTSQGSEFLALQLLLRWHSLTQTTAKERADVTARFARLLSRGSNDPLVIIGAIEMCINFATTFKDRDQYESTFDTLSKLPESLFHAANVPSKAVYKAVFATRWAVAIGNCHDWGATGVPELVKECCSTALNFRNLRAHPFAQLRFGLSVHLYHLGLDLMAAVTNSGVTENRAEVDDLATWLTSHVSVCYRTFRSLHGSIASHQIN
jgi:hypothetical protein